MIHGVSAVRPGASSLGGDPERGQSRARRRRHARAKLIGGVLLGLAAPVLISSCSDQEKRETTANAAREESPSPTTVILILENPANLYGKTVTVSGEVEALRGPRAFTIGGPDWLSGELLILTTDPLPPVRGRDGNAQLARGDLVQVTGPVRRVVIADIEKEIGFDLDRELETAFENKPAVVVKSQAVQITPHRREAAMTDVSPPPDASQDQGNIAQPAEASPMESADAGSKDGGQRDGGQRDGGQRDSGQRDGGQRDGGQRDGGDRKSSTSQRGTFQ